MYRVHYRDGQGVVRTTYTESLRDALKILYRNKKGFAIEVFSGRFQGLIMPRGLITYLLHKLLN